MVRVFFDCSNCVDAITEQYDVHAEAIKVTADYETMFHSFAEYISMSFGTHHAGTGYTTFLEYIEFQDYKDFCAALLSIKTYKYEEAFTRLSRFAIGIINIEED